MAQNQRTGSRGKRKRGTPGGLSRWFQQRMNARMNRKIRRGKSRFMGMELLILHTVGRRSGQRRETPVTWFADGDNAWLVVASGGGHGQPDWYLNLMAHPDQASIELPGRDPMPVAPHRLEGAEREPAWRRVTEAQPRYEKYQRKSDREYPVIRLAPR